MTFVVLYFHQKRQEKDKSARFSPLSITMPLIYRILSIVHFAHLNPFKLCSIRKLNVKYYVRRLVAGWYIYVISRGINKN